MQLEKYSRQSGQGRPLLPAQHVLMVELAADAVFALAAFPVILAWAGSIIFITGANLLELLVPMGKPALLPIPTRTQLREALAELCFVLFRNGFDDGVSS